MIERVYLKEYVTFDEVELEFSEVDMEFGKGLIVFTGPSGAGKSVLMRGILSIFGYFDVNAKVAEALISEVDVDFSKYGIDAEDEVIFKEVKKNKTRYFINNQAISKKVIKEIASYFIDYLSLREIKEFQSQSIIEVLDKMVKDNEFYDILDKYIKLYQEYKDKSAKLNSILEDEKDINEKIAFLKYEISKIESLDPKIGEFEELMKIKKDMSKIEKIKEKIYEIDKIFEFENSIYEFLDMIDEDCDFFSNAMNDLRIAMDKAHEKASFLESVNIEEVLERLSNLQELIRRFGSIEAALEYYEEKKEELSKLENITFEKEELQKELENLKNTLLEYAKILHSYRQKSAKELEDKLNHFLKKLYMPTAKIELSAENLSDKGYSKAEILINDIDINTISTGEFNRLRVALLASRLEYEDINKTLFLDEIDANLSGEESMSVAEVLKYLSQKYQIFAISHQPQLASIADKHFLVTKENNKSFVKELNPQEREKEIARIIGGKNISDKAIEYAKELLKQNKS
ncbi:MAG: AAA family ATPase [Epsilonproteobacteria bacterium]|nr:AAA family ATPase [Campylobacterota bacterium]